MDDGKGRSRAPTGAIEVRQSTVMFVDLVGSTAMANRLEVDDYVDVLTQFFDVVESVVMRHDGFRRERMGDGLYALFGFPAAREGSAEAALRAALEIVGQLARKDSDRLRARIGIATGRVVVFAYDTALPPVLIGPAPNLAHRLQSQAGIGDVLLDDATRQLGARAFETTALGRREIEGFDEPVAVHLLSRERPEVDVPMTNAMVGRTAELGVLERAWQDAREGRGQAVYMTAEAGTGKSRLAAELVRRIRPDAGCVLPYLASERFENTTLYPIVRRIEIDARFEVDDTPEQRLFKFDALLGDADPRDDRRRRLGRYVGDMLGLPVTERYGAIDDTPERRRERLLEVLRDNVDELVRHGPLVLLFEDWHWTDRTTRDLIEMLVVHIESRPVLLLVTSRPVAADEMPAWRARANAVTLDVGPLTHDDVRKLVLQVDRDNRLSPEAVESIVVRSEGLPLNAEELAQHALEGGVGLPVRIEELITARLDRLGAAKEIAQVAAVIGREFDVSLVAEALRRPVDALTGDIEQVVRSGLVVSRGESERQSLAFRHALIQQAAYRSLVRGRREELHRRAAEGIEKLDPQAAKLRPETLAFHYAEAGLPHLALPCRMAAGASAFARAAFPEATAQFGNALQLVASLPDGLAKLEAELGARIQHGLSASSWLGYASPIVAESYRRARELCDLFGNVADLFPVLRGLWAFYTVRAQPDVALDLARQCLRLGEETGKVEFLIEGHVTLGYSRTFAGELVEAATSLRTAAELYRASDGANLAWPAPQDPRVAALSLLSHNLLLQGDAAGGRAAIEDAIATADALNRPYERAFAHTYAAMFEQLQSRFEDCVREAEIAIAIAEEHKILIWLACAKNQWGVAKAMLGDFELGIATAEGWLKAYHDMGGEVNAAYVYAGLAEAHAKAGDLAKAKERAAKALELSRAYGEWYLMGYYERVMAQMRGATG
ncbi:MAG: AAA family ATPase [Burkholderiales bacterium]|nr:AAA family ATPase [Burkholderiales bacterium]